jgi:hypothetical protein
MRSGHRLWAARPVQEPEPQQQPPCHRNRPDNEEKA